jgi:hypothetical protein
MFQTPAPRCQMQTRASNKAAHPGYADRVKAHRTPAEAQKEHTAKAQAKAAREETRQNSINCTAEFKVADIAEEGLVDVTPRPHVTPKTPRNPTHSDLPSLALSLMSNDDMTDDPDRASSVPPRSERTVSADPVEDSMPTPSPKTRSMGKGALKVAGTAKSGGGKVIDNSDPDVDSGGKQVENSEKEVNSEAPSNAEPLQVPKRKKAEKKAIRDEINIAAKNIERNGNRKDKYRALSNKQGESPLEAPSQPQAIGGNRRLLKRQGVMVFDEEDENLNPADQQSKRPKQNNDT